MATQTPLSHRERVERREKTATLLREPEFFEDLLDEVSDGKTLLDFTAERGVIYGRVHRWIMSDESRTEAFAEAEAARAKNLSDRVIRGIVAADETTVQDLLDADGNPLEVGHIPVQAARAIQSIEVEVDKDGGVTKKIKMQDKLKALEMAGRNQQMFTDKVKVEAGGSLADLVAASMKPKE